MIDVPALELVCHRMRKDGAVGVDGVTKEKCGLKTKPCRHQPIRRVHIPKDRGKTLSVGISAFEERMVRDAVCIHGAPARGKKSRNSAPLSGGLATSM